MAISSVQEADSSVTGGGERFPDFFICGAAKSGTTSLWRYLQQHPEVFMPRTEANKEPGYFSRFRPLNDRQQYVDLFRDASEHQLVGEASGAYLTSPDSASRIAEAVPDAKIIIMLRNPADRAYSLYEWMAKEGYEYACTFEEALRLEETRRYNNPEFRDENPEYYFNYLYFHSGLYAKQVERYVKKFGCSQLLFIVFEQFISDTLHCTKKAFRFLGVEESCKPSMDVHNKGKSVWSPPLQFALRTYFEPIMRKGFGKIGSDWIRRLMQVNERPKSRTLNSSLRRRLLNHYRDDIRRTSSLIDKDLEAIWLN